jgi:membrane dipeptidase
MPLIFDSHLDLAWSAVSFDRDLTLPVEEIRRREAGMTDHPSRGRNVLSLPELRRAGVGVCVGTLLARGGPEQAPRAGYARTDLDHADPGLAHCAAQGQLAWYRLMERRGHVRIIRTAGELDAHWAAYAADPMKTPLGVILSMEGTDPVTHPDEMREWFAAGLRAAGLAHYGRGQHAYGTATSGPLSAAGIELLRTMDDLGMILDVTHLSDVSMGQAFDYFDGPLLASHHNCRALVPGDRQLADGQITRIVGRGGVIGVALDAWMLYPGWVRGETRPEVVSLAALADHVDHVCQIAGDARHVALGTDLDGGFGFEQTPGDLKVYGDLQAFAGILGGRGYSAGDVDAIFHGNWLGFFRSALPH